MSQFFIEHPPILLESIMMTTTRFSEIAALSEFESDIKKLLKKFPTLEEDLETLIDKSLYIFHKKGIAQGIFLIAGLDISYPKIFKVKKIACRSLKGKGVRSGLRLIYAYYEDIDKIELIEIYYKLYFRRNNDIKLNCQHYKPLSMLRS